MSVRPTPEQIARYEGPVSMSILRALAYHGYVIAHPDDVPETDPADPGSTYNGTWGEGWNACRARVFGSTT